jgi:hypothetical protein
VCAPLCPRLSFCKVNGSTGSFRYDVVDVARQLVCNVHSDLAVVAGIAFERFQQAPPGDATTAAALAVNATQGALVALIHDVDALLASHESYMIGPRLNEATAWAGGNASRVTALQYQFLNQVTIWGPTHALSVSSGHNDYAAKNWWAGLVGK